MVRFCSKDFLNVNLFNPSARSMRQLRLVAPFTPKETKKQKEKLTQNHRVGQQQA